MTTGSQLRKMEMDMKESPWMDESKGIGYRISIR